MEDNKDLMGGQALDDDDLDEVTGGVRYHYWSTGFGLGDKATDKARAEDKNKIPKRVRAAEKARVTEKARLNTKLRNVTKDPTSTN